MPQARSGRPLRRAALAVVSLAVAGGLAAAVLAVAGPRPRPVSYKMAARFAYPGVQVGAMALTPDGKTVYVGGGNTVTPISTATGLLGKPITIGGGVTALAVAPDGTTLYAASIASDSSGTVTPVSTATGTPGMPVSVGMEPLALAITPDGTSLFAAAFMGTPFSPGFTRPLRWSP